MRTFALCLSYLLLTLVSSSAFADVILKDGKVVKVGRNAVLIKGKIRIADCTTGQISEYEQGTYEYRKGQDCATRPSDKAPPAQPPVVPLQRPSEKAPPASPPPGKALPEVPLQPPAQPKDR
jgi:hypothetical protein